MTRAATLGNLINAAGNGATFGAMRAEGAATRAAMNAPRTIRIMRH